MKKGVTLIEVLVASLILVIGVLGSMFVFKYAYSTLIDTSFRRESVAIIDGQLDNYATWGGVTAFTNLNMGLETNGSFSANGGNKQYKLTLTSKKVNDSHIPPNIIGKNLPYVQVTGLLEWINSLGNKENMEISTYIAYTTAE